MKILHIHPSLGTGGIESMIVGLANEMAKTEEVEVCSIYIPQKKDFLWNKISPNVKKTTLGKKKQGFSLIELWEISNKIKKNKYDIVNIHGSFKYYLIAILINHRRTKFFYTVHSDANRENSSWDLRILKLKKMFFKLKWMLPITISLESQKSFKQLYQVDSQLITNGINILQKDLPLKDGKSIERITPNTKLFVHVGRIDVPKNQVFLCQCIQYLIGKGEDIMLLIAGPIARSDIFESLSKFFSDRIIYIGEIRNAIEYFAEADAMLLPSIWEGLPITLLESMSVGCIPICTPVGGIPNVIDNKKNGLLSKTSARNDYINTLQEFLALSENELAQMRKDAVTTVKEKFSIQATALNYLNAYQTYSKKS